MPSGFGTGASRGRDTVTARSAKAYGSSGDGTAGFGLLGGLTEAGRRLYFLCRNGLETGPADRPCIFGQNGEDGRSGGTRQFFLQVVGSSADKRFRNIESLDGHGNDEHRAF